jgi:uncharacterized protein (TIGR03118 family)
MRCTAALAKELDMRTQAICVVALFGCTGTDSSGSDNDIRGALQTSFGATNLVSDQANAANHQDKELVNAWGIAAGEQGFWIADNGTGKISIVDGNGVAANGEYVSDKIAVEPGITGMVGNETTDFTISCNGESAPADFVVASETGKIWGVNGDVNATMGITVVDRSSANAIYKGVAIIANAGTHELLAADFHNGRIDVFDASFHLMPPCDAFVDSQLPDGYAPFNVVAIGDRVYVTYAKQDADAEDEVDGPGLGAIDVYDTSGVLMQRLATGGDLDAPWGIAMPPDGFGAGSNVLLVGNFGDGRINVVDSSGAVTAQLEDASGSALEVDGLWGITFGDGKDAGDAKVLYFAAGPDAEQHGLFGRVQ